MHLLVHNLPEPKSGSMMQRSEEDVHLFQEVVKDEFRMNVTVSRCFRVRKSREDGKARLLIVTLDTPGVKRDILRLAPQLRDFQKWGMIYITPDLTTAEREAACKVREELAARRTAGETNLTIRRGRVVKQASPSSGSPGDTSSGSPGTGHPSVPKSHFCLGVRVENSSPDKIARVEISEQNVSY